MLLISLKNGLIKILIKKILFILFQWNFILIIPNKKIIKKKKKMIKKKKKMIKKKRKIINKKIMKMILYYTITNYILLLPMINKKIMKIIKVV